MKKLLNDRRFRLVRNIVIIVLALWLLWFFLGMPAFTKQQAFRRAMKEHFLAPLAPEVYFGESDVVLSALANVDGIYVQTGLQFTGFSWQHGNYWSETTAADGVYIMPLFASGGVKDSPDVAVKADGARAELSFFDETEGVECVLESMGRQDGWFLFRFASDDKNISIDRPHSQSPIVTHGMYRYLDVDGHVQQRCSFTFISYDEAGTQLIQVKKNY